MVSEHFLWDLQKSMPRTYVPSCRHDCPQCCIQDPGRMVYAQDLEVVSRIRGGTLEVGETTVRMASDVCTRMPRVHNCCTVANGSTGCVMASVMEGWVRHVMRGTGCTMCATASDSCGRMTQMMFSCIEGRGKTINVAVSAYSSTTGTLRTKDFGSSIREMAPAGRTIDSCESCVKGNGSWTGHRCTVHQRRNPCTTEELQCVSPSYRRSSLPSFAGFDVLL